MKCAICEARRPRRFCPGVHGDICTLCCGTEREVSVSCPLDCEYLEDARRHEKPPPVNPEEFPNQDIRVSEDFLQKNEALLVYLGRNVMEAALDTPGAVDYDVCEALAALVRTYRSLESDIYYDTRPDNSLANNIYSAVQDAVAEYRRRETEARGMAGTRDADVLGLLAFLQRLELDRNNGRKRGRAFIDFLRSFFASEPESAAPLIVPGR